MNRGSAASAIAVLDITGYFVLGAVNLIASEPGAADPLSMLLFGAAVAAFSVMGALLVRRVPGNRVGTLLLATGTAQVLGTGLLLVAGLGESAAPPWPGAAVMAAFGDVAYTAPFLIALIGVPLVFPDGHLPSPRFRWAVGATLVGMAFAALAGLVALIPGLSDPGSVGAVLGLLTVGPIIFGFCGAGVATWIRFRHGGPVQRQQVKWLLAVAGLAVVAFPPALILGSSESPLALAFWAIAFLAYLALPVVIGVAILRYRLYEIDRIISRTIGYAVVTVTLAVVFAGANLLFQAVLTPLTGGNTVAVAASTLAVAALFQPLRQRVRQATGRRFNRSYYDAERTVAAFTTQLREEVDLESLGADVRTVVARTVAPATIGLWIRPALVEPGPGGRGVPGGRGQARERRRRDA